MSSAHVRGQAKPFEKTSSNKRKRATQQNPTHTSVYFNMHPPLAAQELSDHHMRTLEAEEDHEAAALLNHMHLMDHDDHPRRSDNLLHGDYHENGNAAGNHFIANHEVLHRPHPHARGQFARENSGSSDASATNYFSGDSDLTAEPIMGCAADEDGAKSSNSGSSTPFKVSRRALPSPDHAQALVTSGEVQECSVNLLPQPVKTCTGNNKEEAEQRSPNSVPVMQPSTSTTSTSMRNCNSSPESKLLVSSQQMHTHAAGTPIMMRGCHSSQIEGADPRSGSESWLDLRLGYSAETQHEAALTMNGSLLAPRDEQKKSGESLHGTMESAPVTLQLLPDTSKVTEVSGAGTGDMMRAGIIDPGSCRRGEFPSIYCPTASDFAHARPKLAENHHTTARFVPPDHQQMPLDKSKHLAAAGLQLSDHQRFLMNQSNDPVADLHQNNQHPALSAGIVYEHAPNGYVHGNDQRRWLAAETSDMMMMTAPPMSATARPAEIYRPTASVGWPTNRSVDTRPWSANTTYTPPAHMQRTMSWQGLLRSMTTDPLLHPLPDLPMCSFDASGTPEMPGSRRRPMFPVANANRPLPPGRMRPTNHQPLRLSTSRRSAGLWFSLQEAHPYSNENMEDEEEQHSSSMQKVYLRIRDGKMQISVLQSYLLRKLQSSGSYDSHEVEITCRGKTLAPTLTIQHVRDTIWLGKEVELNEAIGFKYTHTYLSDTHNKIMALCYQRHHTQSVTLNLLKT